MSVIRLQNENGDKNIVYEFDPESAPLGEGGMGRVFRGRRIDLAHNWTKDVAIKMMFDDLPNHVIERARREASIRILNDNLLEMIDFVEVCERNAYGQLLVKHYHVVSEFLDGVNLDDLLMGKTVNHNGQPNQMAIRLYSEYQNNRNKFVGFVFRNILSGIMALHYSGYIHRDVDPSNIMVTSDGKIKLIDFGIARSINALGTQDRHLTSSGQFIGKPYYAAPELILGDISHQDYRTDIYALGIMLFQLLTGHLPFEGPMHEVSDKQLYSKLPLKDVQDKVVRKIIEKATEKKQEKRYQTAAEFLVDLDRWILSTNGTGGRAISVQKPVKPAKPAKERKPIDPEVRKNLVRVSTIAASIAVILVSVVMLWDRIIGLFPEKDTPSSGGNIVEVPKQNNNNDKVVEKKVEAPKAVERPKTVADATQLLMNKSTAREGWDLLNSLVEKDDYEATFLKSRILFDPTASGLRDQDALFYREDWKLMRENRGIEADNRQAHILLKHAFDIYDKDHVSLYELGCDYMSGNRGCDREARYAKWCFEEAQKVLPPGAELYKKELDGMLIRLKSYKSLRPGGGNAKYNNNEVGKGSNVSNSIGNIKHNSEKGLDITNY
jgi:serine/threonine-protein kinase